MKKTIMPVLLVSVVATCASCFSLLSLSEEQIIVSHVRGLRPDDKDYEICVDIVKKYGIDKTQAMLERKVRESKEDIAKREQALEETKRKYEKDKAFIDYLKYVYNFEEQELQLFLDWRKKQGV